MNPEDFKPQHTLEDLRKRGEAPLVEARSQINAKIAALKQVDKELDAKGLMDAARMNDPGGRLGRQMDVLFVRHKLLAEEISHLIAQFQSDFPEAIDFDDMLIE
ncbi:MAG: hypothetical protein AAB420_01055 [Patescibacteria group bacterium]